MTFYINKRGPINFLIDNHFQLLIYNLTENESILIENVFHLVVTDLCLHSDVQSGRVDCQRIIFFFICSIT